MLKKTGKVIAAILAIIFTACVSGIVSFTVTLRMLEENGKKVSAELAVAAAEQSAESTSEKAANSVNDGYIVRLEGRFLGVYVSGSRGEELLYSEPVSVADLSEEDERLLRAGVWLENPSELTEFIENFTS